MREFEEKFRVLSVSVSPNIHLVFSPLTEFLETKGLVGGLGCWSEQAMESVHHDIKEEWARTKVKRDHAQFGGNFLKFIFRYNSKHV